MLRRNRVDVVDTIMTVLDVYRNELSASLQQRNVDRTLSMTLLMNEIILFTYKANIMWRSHNNNNNMISTLKIGRFRQKTIKVRLHHS